MANKHMHIDIDTYAHTRTHTHPCKDTQAQNKFLHHLQVIIMYRNWLYGRSEIRDGDLVE